MIRIRNGFQHSCKLRTGECVALSRGLLERIDAAATEHFEPRDSFIVALIELGLKSHRDGTAPDRVARARRRDGGKIAAKLLLRPVKASSKHGRLLTYFLDETGTATVCGAMKEFYLSRPGVFAAWTALNRDHGIGYLFDAASDSILVHLPCDEADVFAV